MTIETEWRKDFCTPTAAAKQFHITPRRLLGIIAQHKLTVIRLGWRILVPLSTMAQIEAIGTAPYEPRAKKPAAPDPIKQNLQFDFVKEAAWPSSTTESR